jgi:hypothetical protein
LIGLTWPEADEDKLYADGRAWIDYGSQLRAQAEQADTAARQVWTDRGESGCGSTPTAKPGSPARLRRDPA